VKAIVFDVDGTLYRQGPLRRAMLMRLLTAHIVHPRRAWRTFTVLRAYRHAQEHLRGDHGGDIAAAQIAVTSERTNIDESAVTTCVTRWMEREPLAFLPRCLQPGMVEFLRACKGRGLRLGAFSDYPAEDKLRAMGVSELFDVVLSAQSPGVGALKPNPRGLLVTLERLGATPSDALYVGDRVDVDAAAARAAGVRCAILTRHASTGAAYVAVSGYPQLHDLLWR
jgi:HAD superfamily hydrolase (TIGR01549 family)